MNRQKSFFSILTLGSVLLLACACSRETTVYSDPARPTAIVPVSTDGRAFLPADFYDQSVNQASVEIQPDGISGTSKALRFQTSSGANSAGGFNGLGTGNRAVLGLDGFHAKPVAQAEPITFDAKNFAGNEKIGANLQIDLQCDGTLLHVVNASGTDISVQSHSGAGDGYERFTASTLAAVWLAPTAAIINPTNSAVLVPASGTPVSLSALLARYPSACLKNASTNAVDLAKGIPTAAVLLSLGSDSTTTLNSTFVRRISIGSEVYEGLE